MVGRIVELNGIIKALWDKHPQGFYPHPENGKKVQGNNYRGLFKYLTKYLASLPIDVSRITCVSYGYVSCYYQSYRSKQLKYECFEEIVFILHMVQHFLPKVFQLIRYYKLQATKSFKK